MHKFIVVCYAIHEKSIASAAPFDNYEDAVKNIKEDAKNTYNKEIENSGNSANSIVLEIDEDHAELKDIPAECCWTWDIISV